MKLLFLALLIRGGLDLKSKYVFLYVSKFRESLKNKEKLK